VAHGDSIRSATHPWDALRAVTVPASVFRVLRGLIASARSPPPWPALLAGLNTYLDQERADPTADSVGYTQVPLWLSQDELAGLIDEVRSALMARRDNGPTPDRSPYLVSPILFPLGEPAQRAGRT